MFLYLLQLKVGVLLTLFEGGKPELQNNGVQRAHMALLAAQQINSRDDILPSYKV